MIDVSIIRPQAPKAFAAELFCSSVLYNGMSLPWFADYLHLTFWFFFLTALIISIWLVQVFFLLIRCGESRLPIRETRGFSRAQVGDTLTAIIPMAWSITMLMHASTHSSNFDENTDSTAMSLTVMAYQWGWNYFFPGDTVAKLRGFSAAGMQQTSQLDQSAEGRVVGSGHHFRRVSLYCDYFAAEVPDFISSAVPFAIGSGARQGAVGLTLRADASLLVPSGVVFVHTPDLSPMSGVGAFLADRPAGFLPNGLLGKYETSRCLATDLGSLLTQL